VIGGRPSIVELQSAHPEVLLCWKKKQRIAPLQGGDKICAQVHESVFQSKLSFWRFRCSVSYRDISPTGAVRQLRPYDRNSSTTMLRSASGHNRSMMSEDDRQTGILRVTQTPRWTLKNCCGAICSVEISATDGSLPNNIDRTAQTLLPGEDDPNRTKTSAKRSQPMSVRMGSAPRDSFDRY
jgi:hypothetical protein